MKRLITLIVAFALTFVFCGCVPGSAIKVDINFIVDDEVYDSVKTDKKTIDMPADPQKYGYDFEGWFWDKEVWKKPFTIDSIPNEDNLCLYAKFSQREMQQSKVGKFLRMRQDLILTNTLSYDELKSIYYHYYTNLGLTLNLGASFEPHIKIPLNADTENKIKQTFLDEYNLNYGSNVYTLDDITISNYCGIYEGAVAVMLEGIYNYSQAAWTESVFEFDFNYSNGNYLLIWIDKTPLEDFFVTGIEGGLMNFPYELYVSGGELSNIVPIRNTAEAEIFNGAYSQTWSDEKNSWVRDSRFTTRIYRYDENFFRRDQLLMFFITAPGEGYSFRLSSTVYSNDILTIKIKRTQLKAEAGSTPVRWFAVVQCFRFLDDTEVIIDIAG